MIKRERVIISDNDYSIIYLIIIYQLLYYFTLAYSAYLAGHSAYSAGHSAYSAGFIRRFIWL